ncbi:acyl-CoA dehydrogenase family protein [Streptomyces sp. NPDC048254]|uniref:acyl-CoA dehydrogenase family protein n=1 Tax=Streptomyces sp. NPDC048254 TaxID=3365525 RepID=UPI00371232F3
MSVQRAIWSRFEPVDLNEHELALQQHVREFLREELPRGTYVPGLGMNAAPDPEFSKKLATRGWLGMALPRRYGGGDRSVVERFVVTEELLRWGAPTGHHWIADRQSGPVINRFGTEEQKTRFLPGICRGELAFSIGMSEPDAGSDLASVKTRAERVDGGWLVNGTKVWTTGAHRNDWLITLCRTTEEADRHRGLSQLIIDLRGDGVQVKGIPFLDGTSDFNEVALRDVFVPDDLLLGEPGSGWAQSGSELAYERGGPERWLSTYIVAEQFLRELQAEGRPLPAGVAQLFGEAVARWWCLRGMSLGVARRLDAGENAAVDAALVKEMGTRFEQDVLAAIERLADLEPSPQSASLFERLLVTSVLAAPSYTLRGGTTEVLRSVVMKGLTA